MTYSAQEFLAEATVKAAEELEQSLLRLPEEKRLWKPGEKSRSALDQVAECAIMNGNTTAMLQTHLFPSNFAHLEYQKEIAELCADWPSLQKLLRENTAAVAEAIRAVPESDLKIPIEMPWGPISVTGVMSYPYWNMSYHQDQINASMLGCLD